jgi:hypothetical protein
MHDITTLAEIATRCGVSIRTAQRLSLLHEIGSSVGGTRILTSVEADRLAEIIRTTKRGRPKSNP